MAAESITQGRRINDGFRIFDSEAGDYWRQWGGTTEEPEKPGEWMVRTPDNKVGSIRGHSVEEHEDGTITVSPSILCTKTDHGHDWHGFLERGVWREV